MGQNMNGPPVLEAVNPRGRNGAGYPAPATRLGKAWANAWAQLEQSGDEWLDGTQVAKVAAESTRPHLAQVTMVSLLARMAAGGILEASKREASGTRGKRVRAFYRLPRAGGQ